MAEMSSGHLKLKSGEDADEHFFNAGFTDGLPVVIPTVERVAKMLRGTALPCSQILGQCPPSYFDVSVEKLAIAAVMAGCTPEMFRIVVAAARAMLKTEFGLHGVHATTMGATPIVVVNGPCRHSAKVNFQHAVCGSGNRSTSIGRALKLVLQNVGRAKLAGTESTTIGTPMKFGMCFGEWEERSAMWDPLAVTMGGAKRDEDAVTVYAATSGPVQLVDFDSTPEQLLDRLSRTMASAYSVHMPFVNYVLLVLCPEHYDTLQKAGIDSKDALSKAIWQRTARLMVEHLPSVVRTLGRLKLPRIPGFIFASLGTVVAFILKFAMALGLPFTKLPKFNTPNSIKVVVAGAEAGKFSSFLPSFGVGTSSMPSAFMSHPITLPVEPRPPKLDEPETAGAKGANASAVLDPVATLQSNTSLVKRTGTLLGPVALMDISKARGSELLDVYEEKLKASGIETKRFMKPTFCRPCPESLLQEIASSCKSAIIALAD